MLTVQFSAPTISQLGKLLMLQLVVKSSTINQLIKNDTREDNFEHSHLPALLSQSLLTNLSVILVSPRIRYPAWICLIEYKYIDDNVSAL